ncbi:MAG: hypothetical protein KatS3mg035_0085 [Bacteroidia bacterium]|nr:MAG: hypothetical protein KatS3mg035_0085 [Bacteroidia bacterium]
MNKFQNKYLIPSTRLQNWDYRWAGAYFITICTHNREHDFGEIHNGKMEWSHIGIIADILWYEIPYHAQNVELGAFVVMPNRIRNGGRDRASPVSTTIPFPPLYVPTNLPLPNMPTV